MSVVDPLGSPLVAQTVDIETAAYSGQVSNALPDGTGFTYTHDYLTATDDYSVNLDYIDSARANGKDRAATPSTASSGGTSPIRRCSMTAAPGYRTSPAPSAAAPRAASRSPATTSSPGACRMRAGPNPRPLPLAAPWTVLEPTPLPRGTVVTGLANNSFTMTLFGGTTPGTVDISTASSSATLVYQVDRLRAASYRSARSTSRRPAA